MATRILLMSLTLPLLTATRPNAQAEDSESLLQTEPCLFCEMNRQTMPKGMECVKW